MVLLTIVKCILSSRSPLSIKVVITFHLTSATRISSCHCNIDIWRSRKRSFLFNCTVVWISALSTTIMKTTILSNQNMCTSRLTLKEQKIFTFEEAHTQKACVCMSVYFQEVAAWISLNSSTSSDIYPKETFYF